MTYILAMYAVKVFAIDGWRVESQTADLWFVSLVGLLAFKLLSNPFFIPPSETLACSVTSAFVLMTMSLATAPVGVRPLLELIRLAGLWVIGIAAVAAVVAVLTGRGEDNSASRSIVARVSYRTAERLGRSELAFTFPALISILGFHGNNPRAIALLLSLWVFILLGEPAEALLRIRNEVSSLVEAKSNEVGRIQRIDSPNIVRVELKARDAWSPQMTYVACFASGEQSYVLPLFYQIQDLGLVGTGLCAAPVLPLLSSAIPGTVFATAEAPDRRELIRELTGLDAEIDLVGFVVEGSTIASIRFEVAAESGLREGAVVFCRMPAAEIVYYQILDASTTEESFTSNPRGTHVVVGAQLGILDKEAGFRKFPWVPEMNSPVFLPTTPVSYEPTTTQADFVLGQVPGTGINVIANFDDLREYHAAILGVTGTGKTELALDIIRQALKVETKVFCVDFTGEYLMRLATAEPVLLGITDEETKSLATAIDAVEGGQYSAAEEKRQLASFLGQLEPVIDQKVDRFLRPDGSALGIFELPELANTRATLRATEMYLSSIFRWARSHRRARKVLIVLEEAHTIVPEFNFFSRDRSDTDAVVGRMAQIALQGRKYGVGLLLVSQRTALVSKTLLSQCNTCITFNSVDKTSLDYLSNFYSPEHVRAIPNLMTRQAMAFGKAVRSERPVLVEIPFDPAKKHASEALAMSLSVTPSISEQIRSDAAEVDDDEVPF